MLTYYFTGDPIEYKAASKCLEITTGGNYWIYECFFSFLDNRAIKCSSTTEINVSIEFCTFYNCSILGQSGGAIYFNANNKGSIVMKSICGFGCFAAQDNFMYALAGKIVYLLDSSINRCFPKTSFTLFHEPLSLRNGNQICSNNNISKNYGFKVSAIHPYNPIKCEITYCYVAQNHAYHSMTIRINGGSVDICKVNIFNNTNDDNSYGILHHHLGISKISECNFHDNSCVGGNLITVFFNSGTISLTSCYIKEGSLKSVSHTSPLTTLTTFSQSAPRYECYSNNPTVNIQRIISNILIRIVILNLCFSS